MKKIILTFLLALSCAISCAAEIRILNTTGEELKVDVLHAGGQARDVVISRSVGLSPAIGPVNPRRTSEVMVLKNAAGTELKRFDVDSQGVFVLTNGSNGYYVSRAGFFKGPTEHGYVKIINATGQEIHYSYETPEFRLVEGKVSNEPGFRDWEVVRDGPFKPDQDIKLKLGINEPASGEGQTVKGGGVYFATFVDGKLKLTKISVD